MYPRIRTKWGSFPETEEINTIYSKKKREVLVDEGALSYEEAGFMEGYEEELDFTDEDHFLELPEEVIR
jgi:hypothetical protein